MGSTLLDSVENSLWHAFEFLSLEGDGTAPKSKLKTLTSQIGSLFDLKAADSGLDDYRSTVSLCFEQYRYYLQKEVFSSLPDSLSVAEQYNYEDLVDETCWKWCSENYCSKNQDEKMFSEPCTKKLFRIFCMLGEMVENDKGHLEVVMAAEEVENVVFQFINNLGQGQYWSPEEFDSVASVIPAFKFGVFLTILENKYTKGVDEGGIIEAVQDIHDFFILDVIKKGHLSKKSEYVPIYREHFFVLRPHALVLYSGASQKEKRGTIIIDGQCRVESIQDSTSKYPVKSPGSKSHSKFRLFAREKNFEFQATDHRTRLQWLTSFKTAINYSDDSIRYQRCLLDERKALRQEEKEKVDQEIQDKTDSIEQTKAELEAEKQARINAEDKAATLIKQRAIENEKMAELENIREQLEGLLDEERQAKKDEETVRKLQARILNEEWERRDVLEKLQEEQRLMLEEERRKRTEFEKTQNDKELQLKEAQKRVEEMEKERKRIDNQLRAVQEKTKRANLGQEVLEAKIKVKEQEQNMDLGSISSKLNTLSPNISSYVKNRDRSNYTPMRSASMRETSYSRSIRRSKNRNINNDTVSITISPSNLSVQETSVSEEVLEE